MPPRRILTGHNAHHRDPTAENRSATETRLPHGKPSGSSHAKKEGIDINALFFPPPIQQPSSR
jgi:hypothetical protein